MTVWRVFRTLFAIAIVVGSVNIGVSVFKSMGDPTSALRRYRDAPVAPHVLAQGTLRQLPGTTPPLCDVVRQNWGRCGKSSCWRWRAGLAASTGTFETKWSSSPIPASLGLSTSWNVEPALPEQEVTDASRIAMWQARAKKAGVNFDDLQGDRLVESCLPDGAAVYVEGCVEQGKLTACPGAKRWGIVPGTTPRPAIVEAANEIAWAVAGISLLLLIVPLLLAPDRQKLVDALAARTRAAARPSPWVGVLYFLPLAGFGPNWLLHLGRGGFVALASMVVFWLALARSLLARRRLVADALAPVLGTERSLLTKASGTTELLVRAKRRGEGAPRVIGPMPAAFVETKVIGVYRSGKNVRDLAPIVIRPQRELDVVDESGEGVLDLEHAVLDVKAAKATFRDVPPRLVERGVKLSKHEHHEHFRVEELSIDEGQTLYVLGDVSELTLRPDGAGYRSVQGSPKIGGDGSPPVLVFAGDERGLVGSLRREARGAQLLAIASACTAGLLAGAATFIAMQ